MESVPSSSSATLCDMNTIQVQNPWYNQIVFGDKDVEGRAGGPDKFAGWKEQPVRIINSTKSSAVFTVKDVRHYPDLDAYLKTEGWERVAPHTGSAVGAVRAYRAITMKDGVQVFSDKRVAARGGICALELAPLRKSDYTSVFSFLAQP